MIIVDTNFLVYAVKYKLADELRKEHICIPLQVLKELAQLAKKDSNAKIALQIAKKFEKKKVKAKDADSAIIKLAGKEKGKGNIVATMDSEIKKKLKKICKVMVIRGKKKIVIL